MSGQRTRGLLLSPSPAVVRYSCRLGSRGGAVMTRPTVRAGGCKTVAPAGVPGKERRDEMASSSAVPGSPACSVERGCRACKLPPTQSASASAPRSPHLPISRVRQRVGDQRSFWIMGGAGRSRLSHIGRQDCSPALVVWHTQLGGEGCATANADGNSIVANTAAALSIFALHPLRAGLSSCIPCRWS